MARGIRSTGSQGEASSSKGLDDAERMLGYEELFNQLREVELPEEANNIAFETMLSALREGLQVPQWAISAVARVYDDYQSYKISSFSQALGFPDHKKQLTKRKKLLCGVIANQVHGYREKGFSREEAIASVADKRGDGYSESTVRDLVRRWEGICKQSGVDPYKSQAGFVDADAAVSAAFARAIAKDEPTK